jgi:xanthine/uracil permease
MFMFFLPPVVQVVIGVVILVVGLALFHSVIIAAVGGVGLAVGAVRWVRKQRGTGLAR